MTIATPLWSQARPAQRLAYLAGAVLVGVGLAHGLIWLIVGGTVDGPLSWRKPTTFGISFGLTLATLGWVSQFLSLSDRAARFTLGLLTATFAIEVAWVSVQHAWGVASHFNDSTPLDSGLFRAAGVAVVLAVGVLVLYAVRSFTSSDASPSITLALRAGLLILLASMGAGAWMILRGTVLDLEPATVGVAGSIKLVHGVGMHAIQLLLGIGWIASAGSLPETRRRQLVALGALGYVLLLGETFVLALTGTAATAPGPFGTVVGAAALICLSVAGLGALAGLRIRVAAP